ncbi:hypothetical protein F5Y15DRAFT_191270 [Xylariaceae sp. FL0016]|nr:hypothetical protein F5Y15DRAFT_191270 [Xylariaceae sp. FL0016]
MRIIKTGLLPLVTAVIAQTVQGSSDHDQRLNSALTYFALDDSPYDCNGNVGCNTTDPKWCDQAVNNLEGTDEEQYGSPGSGKPLTGACAGDPSQSYCGCEILVLNTPGGPPCVRSRKELTEDYLDLRTLGHCAVCGTKSWGDGCFTQVTTLCGCKPT